MRSVLDKIRFGVLRQVPRNRSFIFGIGLSKTGTTSLNDALNILGFPAFHLPPICRVRGGDVVEDWPWWIYKFTAMTDLSVAMLHAELDARFPNARFIYTPRDMNSWLSSCQRHFTQDLAQMRVQQNQTWLNDISGHFYGSEIYQPDSYRAAYLAFEEQVMTRYANRSDFLVHDIIGGQGWEPLCYFLNVPVPNQPFPKANKGRTDV